ncbi:MAG: TIGR01777 family oxidoreductase [Polyangiales bacterium]
MKVVVTGGTGFIGRRLVSALAARGDELCLFARDPARALSGAGAGAIRAERWDTESSEGSWQRALSGVDAVIHLAGEPINSRRWNDAQRARILDSRVNGTRNLVTAIARLPSSERPKAFISASGVDYYGDTGDDEKTEDSPRGSTFLSDVCVAWEREALIAREHGLRVSCARTGIVLGEGGGAFEQMLLPFKLFVGGPVGGGAQWFPWLHSEDMVAMYVRALDDQAFCAPFNAVTESVRMRDFAKALGAVLRRPSWLPVPKFALSVALGAMGEVVAESKRVSPAFLRSIAFEWKHPSLDGALRAALGRAR